MKLLGTSRRLNIVTSQCRDVATSRCQRDFSITIIKRKKGLEFKGIEDRMNEGTERKVVVT